MSVTHLLGEWSLQPALIAVLLGIALAYGLLAGRRRARWPIPRFAAFTGGLVVLAIALMSGFDSNAERLLSVHMAQHLLLALLAPALLLWGSPLRLVLGGPRSLRRPVRAVMSTPVARILLRPFVGFAVFATVVLGVHLTGVFVLALQHPALHLLEHAALFWSGVLLLAPLIVTEHLPHRPGPLQRFAWLMAAMTAMAVPGALLTFSESVRYHPYLTAAHSSGAALADQHLGGIVMWVGGGVAMFALALTATMGALAEEERRQRRREMHLRARRPVGVGGP